MAQTAHRSSPSTTQHQGTNGVDGASGSGAGETLVNRKKQKRRQKQAARLAAEQPSRTGSGSTQANLENGAVSVQNTAYKPSIPPVSALSNGIDYDASDPDDAYELREGDELYFSDGDARFADDFRSEGPNGKSKKKKKNKSRSVSQHDYHPTYSPVGSMPTSASTGFNPPPPPPPPPPLSTAALRSAHKVTKDRIWNTSTAEERERIKEFWLSLEEKERRSLVKVEKEAVLKKMKEQQKHSCSCTVCGRKRTAIEEELEVLYDAYYEELEQYANHQQVSLDDGTPMMPPRMYPHPMARMPPSRIPPLLNAQRPARGRIQEVLEDDEEGDEEEFSDEDDEDEDYSEEEPEDEPRGPAADFFNFGNSLTVQGGILTVADDLLKNDGKKFIEMMEQLAERRMQREEEAQYAAAGLRHPSMPAHNHGPPLEDEDYDDEDDDEYDSQDDEDYEEDEMETMTEEQRMEEGRRMFQIFAARMFEQRVLTAYREKVARERQEKLLEELAEESRLDTQREAKKAKEAQKKKDKKRQQKQAKDEEKAKREADKAAEEAAAKAVEEKKIEEQRQKKEEQRKKKEAEKKAQDEERLRKEAEKLKRQQEVREQQLETERKQREQKEREKKKREEIKKKEREEREAKEREIREKKERDAGERKERDAKAKAEKDTRDRVKREEQIARQAAQTVPTPAPPLKRNPTSTAVPIPPGLHPQQTPSSHASPHLQVATPVIPKAPTPARPRQASFQGSHNSSPNLAQVPSGSTTGSLSNAAPQQQATAPPPPQAKVASLPSSLQQPQPIPALPPLNAPPGMTPQPFTGVAASPTMMGNNFPMTYGPAMPGMMQRAPLGHEASMYPHQPPFSGPQYRTNFVPPNGLPFPPGMNGMRPVPHTRGTQMESPTIQAPIGPGTVINTNINAQYGIARSTMPSHSHSRNTSASFEKSVFETPSTTAQTQPIARPAPIQRPASVAPHQQGEENHESLTSEIDDLSSHLGSSALLDDTDVPLNPTADDLRRGSIAPGGPRSGRLGFGASPMFPDPVGSGKLESYSRGSQAVPGNNWGAHPMPFGNPPMSGLQSWSNMPGPGWSSNNAFGIIGGPNRPNASRPVTIRLLVSQACKYLTVGSPTKTSNGFHNVESVLRQVEQLKPASESPIQLRELLDICDTEGNPQNGGGSFIVQDEGQRGIYVKFEADNNMSMVGRGGAAPGDIGSPIPGSNMPTFGGPRPFQPPGGVLSSPSGF